MNPRRRRMHTLALSASLLATLASPFPARAQADSLAAVAATEVLVSRREATVTFPPDPAIEWGWPRRGGPLGEYSWRVSIRGDDAPRIIVLSVEPREGRRFPTLQELVSTGQARVCWPPADLFSCDGTRVRATVRNGRVELAVRDSTAVSDLFGLRPETVTVSVWRPDAPRRVSATVRVSYVDPQLPPPDSAFRAAAAEERRLYYAHTNRATRAIVALAPGPGHFWLAVGDSMTALVLEATCSGNTCATSTPPFADARWSVADTSIARVRPAGPTGAVRIAALRPGRTVLRVTGLHGPRDTVPDWNPLPAEAEREVVVTLPVAAVRLCPRGPIVADAPFPLHVEVVDSGGNVFRDPPVTIGVGNGPSPFPIAPSDTASIRFSGQGSMLATVAFAGHADTLRLRVVPRRPRPSAAAGTPAGDGEGCSASALLPAAPALPPRRE